MILLRPPLARGAQEVNAGPGVARGKLARAPGLGPVRLTIRAT
jgi:hypothetical protein